MARTIDSEVAYRFLTDQLVEETGVFSKGVNKGLNIARSAMRNPDAIPTLAPPNEWINMDDMPPEFPGFLDHIMVITCDKNGYVIPMVRERTLIGYEQVERWLYPWNKIYDGPEITHWMMLPKPPKVTEDVAFSATTESGCEYCSGDPMRPLDWQYGLDHIFHDYKYCPMCGRRVKE